jgi:16S rRNA (adenine1518-N6/adenine1519-N6)-dimethyltransferase
VAALRETVGAAPSVRIVHDDAMHLDWGAILDRPRDASADLPWVLCANLPYTIATPLVLDVLREVPQIRRATVMVQREVGERLTATAGEPAYGAVSVRVATRAEASIVRRVPASVFWPRPNVESVVVRIERLAEPPVDPDDPMLHKVVDVAFAERRKTMRNALRRLGLNPPDADEVLERQGLAPNVRPEELDVETFAAIAAAVRARTSVA